MNSMIYQGEVSHTRLTPLQHRFSYPVYFYAFDLAELEQLARQNPLFGYNQVRPVAIHDHDYLQPNSLPLRQKLEQTLTELGIIEPLGKVMLVTAARYFNYVFNPVSFFYCYTPDQKLCCVLAQVRNTFGEMHIYLLDMTTAGNNAGTLHFTQVKQFHVSPFFPHDGRYEFYLTEPHQQLDNRIHYHQAEQLALVARLQGQAQPLTTRSLIKTIIHHPLSAALTMPRILWQAAKIYWQRRLPVYTKPVPDHHLTIRQMPPSLLDRIGRAFAHRYFSQLRHGLLQIKLPDGELLRYGTQQAEEQQLRIRENRFFRRITLAGEIGFGEAYTDGDWTTDDLPALLTMLAGDAGLLDDRKVVTATVGRWLNTLRHQLRANTIPGSSRNIREHYDLSNDFFATFLDPSMTYSAAMFRDDDQSLKQAQINKLRTMIEKAQIDSSDHVLEIGCGWGSFAIEAVRQTGCRVTGITLSHEQLALARQRVREAGLEGKISLQLCDYRQITGQYDKIVSIEMLEAVGHAGLKSFFKACDLALKPGGRVALQVITIPDRKYDTYRTSTDWIRKHIFPGGHLPSVGAIATAMSSSSLNLSRLDFYGHDYARTLEHWYQALLQQRQKILALGYDERFLRKWEYYFAFCQAGFTNRIIDLAQLVFEKPQKN